VAVAPFVGKAGTRRAKSQERCLLRAPEYYRYPLGENQTVKNKNEKKKQKKKESQGEFNRSTQQLPGA
jgi:hypothetical protein